MKRFNIETLSYLLFTIGLIMVTGATFTGCQAEPAQAKEPTATAESYFQHPEPSEPYNPCKDELLKYERGIEGEQRKKECGVSL